MKEVSTYTQDSADNEKPSTQAYLVLKDEFYDKIKEGKKTVEYRDFTEYWAPRLLDHPMKTVVFSRGYGGERMLWEIEWTGVLDGDREIRAFNEKGEMSDEGKRAGFHPDTIALHLGKRIR